MIDFHCIENGLGLQINDYKEHIVSLDQLLIFLHANGIGYTIQRMNDTDEVLRIIPPGSVLDTPVITEL